MKGAPCELSFLDMCVLHCHSMFLLHSAAPVAGLHDPQDVKRRGALHVFRDGVSGLHGVMMEKLSTIDLPNDCDLVTPPFTFQCIKNDDDWDRHFQYSETKRPRSELGTV